MENCCRRGLLKKLSVSMLDWPTLGWLFSAGNDLTIEPDLVAGRLIARIPIIQVMNVLFALLSMLTEGTQ